MKKILILTAGFGEGHNAAARNLAAAALAMNGPGSAPVADLFELASPRLNSVSRRGYLSLINRAPRVWNGFYGWLDRRAVFPRHLWLLRGETRALSRLLSRERPAAVCSTYPVYGFIANLLASRGKLRVSHHNVVTDSISINSLWTRAPCEAWFVPNAETAEIVRRLGAPADRVHDHGFPVSDFFGRNTGRLSPPDLATGARPRVLFIIHSGVRNAEATARRLLKLTNWEITLAVGRDAALRARLAVAAAGRSYPTAVLGWTDQLPRLLMTSHVVIGKAGGATTQEAIAARCPMIVNQIVPGQEEGNYELLRRREAGLYAPNPDSVIEAAGGLFANGGWKWRRLRAALAPLARTDAAERIVSHVLATAPRMDLQKGAVRP